MKRFVAYLILGVMAIMLAGCGFHLRGTQATQIAMKDMAVNAADKYGSFSKELRSKLTALGVNVHDDAAYVLSVYTKTDQRNLTLSNAARGSDIETLLTVNYQIYGSGHLLLIDNSFAVRSDYVYDSNNILGTNIEEDMLSNHMNTEAINMLILRLQAISSDQLQALQAKAEEQQRQKAEAERLEAEALKQRRDDLMKTIPLDLIELRNKK